MKLYNYFRSSASWRVRIGLALKGLGSDYVPVHLQKNEQFAEGFAARQASHLVPALVLDDGRWLSQSMAILEYLDETHPEPPLLPRDAVARAQVRALAQDIGCDIHPINNLRVLRYLKHDLGQEQEAVDRWYRHWVATGLAVVEQRLADTAGAFCFGDAPGGLPAGAAGLQRPALRMPAARLPHRHARERRLPGPAGLREHPPERLPRCRLTRRPGCGPTGRASPPS
jgi:maleylacetoacetate isomerase/maleylpyruvate isomerase